MKKEKKRFLKLLKKYFKLYSGIRITQALFNLGVTEKAPIDGHFFIDNYQQNDKTTLQKTEEQYERAYRSYFKGIAKNKKVKGEEYKESKS